MNRKEKTSGQQRRLIGGSLGIDFDLRSSGSEIVLRGYAARFDVWSKDLGGFREVVRRGAFAEAIKTSDVRALMNHNPNRVLGRTVAGTLRLAEDETGLAVEIHPPATSFGKDLIESVRRGDITQMSFAFTVDRESEKWSDYGRKREILKVEELFDVSPVTFPAYEDTSVGAHARSLTYGELRNLRRLFQSPGTRSAKGAANLRRLAIAESRYPVKLDS